MTGSFVSFQVASRSMEASQASINVTGNNISNVKTEGYTRQRVDVNSVTISGQVQKYATPQVSTGVGAKATGTTQTRDIYIDARYRNQNGENSKFKTLTSGLTNLEDVFDEADTDGLQNELLDYTNALQSLSDTPTSSDIAQVVRSAAQKVTQVVNMYATQLDSFRTEQTENLNVTVNSEFNTYVKDIASLNGQIQKEEIYGNTPNELYDQRNLLIDKLSAVANIKVTTIAQKVEGSDNLTIPRLSITLNNVTDSDGNPITLVDNDDFATLSMTEVEDASGTKTGEVGLTLEDAKGGINKNAEKVINNGSLKGYLDLINGKGEDFATAGSDDNKAKGVVYYQKALDVFAKKFADVMNKINGYTVDSTTHVTTGTPLYTSDKADTNGLWTENITAKNFQVSKEWLKDPKKIDTTISNTTTGEPDNVLRMISAITNKQVFKADGSDASSPTETMFAGTFNEYMTGLLGELSTDVKLKSSFSKTATNVLNTIADSREQTSGVSLNEEGVNLTAFQKVYNASIRYFNVLDENLDTVINTMGV